MSIIDLVSNTTFMLIVCVLIICIVALVVMSFKPETRVELLRPRDSRGKILRVVEENDLGLTCKKTSGIVHRFIKAGRGWTFNVRGKMITKFFGMEGRAYTGIIKGDEIVNVSVPNFLKWVWGEKFYNAIPEKQKSSIETDIYGITVEVQRVNEDELGLPSLRADDVNDEDESIMIRRFARGAQASKQGSYINYFASGLIGALLMYLAVTQGWF